MNLMRVFISYSTVDLAYATTVKALLETVGFDVFLAEYTLPPGVPIDARIVQAIRQADVLLLIWSKNAHASDWVRDEVGIALGAHKAVLPVSLDPETKMPAFIRGIKYINAAQDQMGSLPIIQKSLMDYAK